MRYGRHRARSTTLLADHVLTNLLGETAQDPLLQAQRFLAETAMITAELPSAGPSRVILIAPPRRWNPPQAFLDRVVEGTSAASWMTGTALTGMRTAPAAEVERRTVHYPASQRRQELPPPYLTALGSLHSKIATFAAVLTQPDKIVPDLDRGLLRLESTWWRNREEARVNPLLSGSSRSLLASSARSTCSPAATPSAAEAGRSR